MNYIRCSCNTGEKIVRSCIYRSFSVDGGIPLFSTSVCVFSTTLNGRSHKDVFPKLTLFYGDYPRMNGITSGSKNSIGPELSQ